jgi:hypothetical protein
VASEGVELKQRTLAHYEPTLHRCHDNVREFVEKYPRYQHVRGFVVANRQPISDTTLVMAHSAVGAPDGSLSDITPSELDVRYNAAQNRAMILKNPRGLIRKGLRMKLRPPHLIPVLLALATGATAQQSPINASAMPPAARNAATSPPVG